MEPKPIEPHDIRVGMRVRRAWRSDDDSRGDWAEFVVTEIDSGIIMRSGGVGWPADKPNVTWTLLADASKPERPVGSHWRDPETGAEYVRTDATTSGNAHYIAYTQRASDDVEDLLVPDYSNRDRATIARLTPIPAFDPAVLWPHAPAFARDCIAHSDGWSCSRGAGHDGMHAAYVGADTPPRYVWGDPR